MNLVMWHVIPNKREISFHIIASSIFVGGQFFPLFPCSTTPYCSLVRLARIRPMDFLRYEECLSCTMVADRHPCQKLNTWKQPEPELALLSLSINHWHLSTCQETSIVYHKSLLIHNHVMLNLCTTVRGQFGWGLSTHHSHQNP